jgi:hypothetical protein
VKIGTRSLLFGVHQVFLHPWFVAVAWWKLYGFPRDFRLWFAFVIHDWGYWGKPNMDGPEGETHPEWAARVMSRLFDDRDGRAANVPCAFEDTMAEKDHWKLDCRYWHDFTLFHSRFYAKLNHKQPSRLCAADKLAIGLMPVWLYLPLAWLTGELAEYMEGKNARMPSGDRAAWQWYADARRYCTAWAYEHRDGKADTWTGTKRDLAIEPATLAAARAKQKGGE